jgi:hypoxanthine phosphoribosyltransferase
MMFKKGQKVVCIDDSRSTRKTMERFEEWIEKDRVYTIREQRPQGAEGGVLLEEVKNPPAYFPQVMGKIEPAFAPRRFREVDGEFAEEKHEHAKVESQ